MTRSTRCTAPRWRWAAEMPKTPTRLVRIAFTKEQLWELMSNFDKSFEGGDPENALADLIAAKLHRAYDVTFRESK